MTMIKRLIWKFRYAWEMNKKSKCGWSFAWYNAEESLVFLEEDLTEDPIDSAWEEMSNWHD